jgi:pyruvate,water dikinase
VIVQREVYGERSTAYTRPLHATGDDMLVQAADRLDRVPRRDDDLLVRAERAIGAEATGADVELVGTWLVQARPIIRAAPRVFPPAPESVIAPLRDGRVWTLDVAHNPDPLSIAQQELVARVDHIGAYSLKVTGGYLYTSPRERELSTLRDPFAVEAELAQLVADTPLPGPLEDALERYASAYAIWAELSAHVAALRPRTATARPSAVERVLLAAARGELTEADVVARLGVLSPAWDVAVPTFAERPELLRDAITRARAVKVTPTARDLIDGTAPPFGGAAAQDIADLAERDDYLFARAQWSIRRALLARARELELGDAVFWLPFHVLRSPIDRDEARRKASAARSALVRAARWRMPVVVGREPEAVGTPLHGVGTGAKVTGRVVRFASLASAVTVGSGDVVVTRAVTPALAVLVVGCAALVSETGGLLDHGAAMARELGIPCVVGCTNAWSELEDGMIVSVDGEAGVVTRT